MGVYSKYNKIGKESIKGTREAVVKRIGENGIKEIIRDILIGKNVRDYTEFSTQKRLINSYSAMVDLYVNVMGEKAGNIKEYADYVMEDYINASNNEKRSIDLWLMGLTAKGLDNITWDNIEEYQIAFSQSMNDIVCDLEKNYGPLTGTIEINGKSLGLSWSVMALMLMSAGAQTLTVRGSEKSTNGKMFEKLILGSLLSFMGFRYLKRPPERIDENDKVFWLSHMDKNEREIDATFVYRQKAVNVDIGFIGKGNPEITLDKVTRFGSYKEIGGIPHNMTTMIIVDTVADNSDLFHKARKVKGYVFQMRKSDWTIEFAKSLCDIMGIEHELASKEVFELEEYFTQKIQKIDVNEFIR